jgi:starch phosphorylase
VEVNARQKEGYDPRAVYSKDRVLADVIDAIAQGKFSPDEPSRFWPIVDSLLSHDPFFVLADFKSYRFSQQVVDAAYRDRDQWLRKAVLNVAKMGRFSSDSTITGYARDIWNVPVCTV